MKIILTLLLAFSVSFTSVEAKKSASYYKAKHKQAMQKHKKAMQKHKKAFKKSKSKYKPLKAKKKAQLKAKKYKTSGKGYARSHKTDLANKARLKKAEEARAKEKIAKAKKAKNAKPKKEKKDKLDNGYYANYKHDYKSRNLAVYRAKYENAKDVGQKLKYRRLYNKENTRLQKKYDKENGITRFKMYY